MESPWPRGAVCASFPVLDRVLIDADRRTSELDLKWPTPSKPMYFHICSGAEEISGSGTSYLNRHVPCFSLPFPIIWWQCLIVFSTDCSLYLLFCSGEATAVEKVVTQFLRAGVLPSQIGVITPYEGQRVFVTQYMQRCVQLLL